ncbi:MAG: nuclear transport factor 2 family protein [Acidimicrobiia bacterium]|nr:nuclear transport factor 2 family protein [Acidimicrobiia bacterium]
MTAILRRGPSRDSKQPSPHEQGEPARLDILSIEISGETAVARVRDDYLGLTFLDSLSLLLSEGRWRIYNKLFNVEGPATVGTPGVD